MPLTEGRYRGELYRALNPVYAREPLSGRGAEIYGGRFNVRGVPALYTALDPSTALREASQVGSLQPTILVSYRADLGPIFDTRGGRGLDRYGLSDEALADPGWRATMLQGGVAPTQELALKLVDDGYAGLLTRSFARGTTASSLNLVLWRGAGDGCSLGVVDDEGRLGRM